VALRWTTTSTRCQRSSTPVEMVTGASASPGDGLDETDGDEDGDAVEAAALVATAYAPGRAKTAAAVTMRNRRYNEGLRVAVGIRGEAQSAHGQLIPVSTVLGPALNACSPLARTAPAPSIAW
jgi:hypothetical protein